MFGRETRQEDVERSSTQRSISPSIQRILLKIGLGLQNERKWHPQDEGEALLVALGETLAGVMRLVAREERRGRVVERVRSGAVESSSVVSRCSHVAHQRCKALENSLDKRVFVVVSKLSCSNILCH